MNVKQISPVEFENIKGLRRYCEANMRRSPRISVYDESMNVVAIGFKSSPYHNYEYYKSIE